MEDDFTVGADFLDEAAMAEAETTRAREERKQARVKLGLDSRTEGTDGVDIEAVAALSLPEREARWGFTSEELASATKVVSRLFTQPHLFVGDPVLADTRLFTMISRDRATKRSNPQVVKQMLAAEQSRRKKQQRQEDIAALQKTKMKQERDAALQALLLPPVDSDDDGAGRMITDGSEKNAPETVETEAHVDPTAAGAAASTVAPADAAEEETPADAAEEETPAEAPTDSQLNRALRCHVCHAKYRALHHYYYSLCPECAESNYVKRLQTCDLRGRTVLLTGCRIKIGYEMALSLLRCGATLVGTTRFIHDALARFAQEKDYAEWSDRLFLYAVDLRDLWMVEQFCAFMNRTHPKLYAIVNNAAQTIARTAEYTAALRHFEANPLPEVHAKLMDKRETVAEWMGFFARHSSLEVGQPLTLEYHPVVEKTKVIAASAGGADSTTEDEAVTNADPEAEERALMQTRLTQQFPKPRYDRYDTQAEASDTRASNSWMKNLAEVDGSEAAEVMAINALAPFILNARLRPLLLRREANEESPEETAARLAPVLAQHKATKAARGESALLNLDGSAAKEDSASAANPGDAPTTGEKIPFMRFIINVSAMEGQFYRFKQTTHPHTNMAKAALNMMTRTSAADYARDGIFMNSVDTGWITDETPDSKRQRQWNGDHQLCPLDEVDAAARCLDLVYIRSPEFGKFWKDYREIPW